MLTSSSVPRILLLVLTLGGSVRGDDFEDEEDIPITGIEQKSIQLACSLPSSDPPRVRWLDYVYNSDPNPSKIFDSWNNSELHTSDRHPNGRSYEVNSNFTLTINNLKVDDDPGQYFCESRLNDGQLFTKSYYVTVGGNPQCSGGNYHGLRVGERTNLECETKYSGNNQPKLTWFREEQPIASKDEFDIRLAKQTVELTVSHTDDDIQYTCIMEFGEFVDECIIKLRVFYPVRDISFYPSNRTQFFVGDHVMCVARGNPVPRLNVEPIRSSRLLSNGSRVIEVDKSWKNKNITLRCSASNTVDGQPHQVETTLTINVIERPTTFAPTLKPTPLPRSKIDSDPGIVGGAIVVVALVLLAIIGSVVLVRKHRETQRRKAAAAKAEANRLKEDQRKGQGV